MAHGYIVLTLCLLVSLLFGAVVGALGTVHEIYALVLDLQANSSSNSNILLLLLLLLHFCPRSQVGRGNPGVLHRLREQPLYAKTVLQ